MINNYWLQQQQNTENELNSENVKVEQEKTKERTYSGSFFFILFFFWLFYSSFCMLKSQFSSWEILQKKKPTAQRYVNIILLYEYDLWLANDHSKKCA